MCYSALLRRQYKDLEKRFGKITVRTGMEFVREEEHERPGRAVAQADRVFPGVSGTVLWRDGSDLVQESMYYGAHPPARISPVRAKSLTTYNARCDNLESPFWEHAFLKQHGLAWLDGFFEWVAVPDLLKAGVVTVDQVRAHFEAQALERKVKLEAQGKKHKLTKTELTDPRFRKIIIQFQPAEQALMLAPVLITQVTKDGKMERRFAIITDDPPPEIAEAGHDRCPIMLTADGAEQWLSDASKVRSQAHAILGMKQRIFFEHRLPEVA